MNKKNWIIGIAAVILAVIFPYVAPKFQLRMFTEIIILTLFAMTWKMMLNEGGMFSFGHAVYFGVGAYASVLGWLHIPGLSFLSGILLGALFCCPGSFHPGRLFGPDERDLFRPPHAWPLINLIWAIVWKWRDVTGGDDGLGKFPKPDLLGISMKNPVTFYYVALILHWGLSFCLLVFYSHPSGKYLRQHQVQ